MLVEAQFTYEPACSRRRTDLRLFRKASDALRSPSRVWWTAVLSYEQTLHRAPQDAPGVVHRGSHRSEPMKEKLPSRFPRCDECGRPVHPGQVVAFTEDGRLRHARCPPGDALESFDEILSETAEALLAFLQTLAESVVCENCAAAYLKVDRAAALKSIRELILNGRIFCRQASCAVCHEERVVAELWRERPES
jgi:hypothetical protein